MTFYQTLPPSASFQRLLLVVFFLFPRYKDSEIVLQYSLCVLFQVLFLKYNSDV